jgi:hypothetical protein
MENLPYRGTFLFPSYCTMKASKYVSVFFCVGVMYSDEYERDVTVSVYPHRASLKNMPISSHGGNRTYDLWNTSNHVVIMKFILCWCNVLRRIWCLWCYSECISTSGKLETYAWARWGNITSIIFTWVHYTNTEKNACLIDYIDIEGTRLSSETSHAWTDLNA